MGGVKVAMNRFTGKGVKSGTNAASLKPSGKASMASFFSLKSVDSLACHYSSVFERNESDTFSLRYAVFK